MTESAQILVHPLIPFPLLRPSLSASLSFCFYLCYVLFITVCARGLCLAGHVPWLVSGGRDRVLQLCYPFYLYMVGMEPRSLDLGQQVPVPDDQSWWLPVPLPSFLSQGLL